MIQVLASVASIYAAAPSRVRLCTIKPKTMPEQIATHKTFVNGVYFSLKDYPHLVYQLQRREYTGEIPEIKTVDIAVSAFYKGFKREVYEGCNLRITLKGIVFFSVVSSVTLKSAFIPFNKILLVEPRQDISMVHVYHPDCGCIDCWSQNVETRQPQTI